MSLWTFSRGSHAQSLTVASAVINVPAGRMLRFISGSVVGMASAAVAGAEFGIYLASANGSGGSPTSITPKPVDPNADGLSVPSGFSIVYGYTTEPTLESDPKARLRFQPLGGRDWLVAVPGAELEFWKSTAYQVALRGISGTPNVAFDFTVELKP
ncbi:hypothetical protein [Piscinibacter defluvii]|uniref:hypothetical protein n=1 Tax=Piscinibacter defluvii TaxID=1796922 RepID=UPI000FDF4899|nr:hypothetical protein [Piscinibacter defluvii]